MSESVDHRSHIAEGIENWAGASVLDVVTHSRTGFRGCAAGSQHLNDLVGNQTACGFDLLVGGRPCQDFANCIEKRLGNSRSFHDVWLLTQILSDHHAGHVERGLTIFVNAAHHQLRSIDVVE